MQGSTNLTDLASRLEHTLLEAEADAAAVDRLADEAALHGLAGACVNPVHIARLKHRLEGTGVRAVTVIGFPLGANSVAIKAIEAREAIEKGADEIDVVPNPAALLARDLGSVTAELAEVVRTARASNPRVTVKAIIESARLMRGTAPDEAERRIQGACRSVRESGCDFVSTSTGFHPAGGATVEAVALLRKHSRGVAVKAAGGILRLEDAARLLEAGADRLGTPVAAAIVADASRAGA